jgi:hypothetical protein
MNEDSMPIPIISEVCMEQGYRKFLLMPVLPVQTAMDQKVLEVVPIAIMMLLTLLIASLQNRSPGKLRRE